MSSNAEGSIALSGRALAVSYGRTRVLDGVDIDLRCGRISVILGPSGAGKSTLMRAIAGFEPLSGGRIEQDGRVLSDEKRTVPPEDRSVGIVVQDFALFPHLTAWKNVAFGLSGPKPERRKAAMEALRAIDLEHRADAYPHELSGGERQRVALARALAPSPSVILLDEAFSSLDPQLRRTLRRETESILRASGAGVLVVTHDPDEAMEMADELIVMGEGRVLQRGSPAEVYWHPADLIVAQLLGEVNIVEGVCEGGAMQTPFGRIEHPSMTAGKVVKIVARPSALSISAGAQNVSNNATVVSVGFMGAVARVVVEAKDGSRATLVTHGGPPPAVGAKVSLTFDPERIAILP